jgi:hypothetical protein
MEPILQFIQECSKANTVSQEDFGEKRRGKKELVLQSIQMTDEPHRQEIARRALVDRRGCSVDLVICAPEPDPSCQGNWLCRVEIVTAERTQVFDANGADSLQALSLGLGSLRYWVGKMELGSLSWLGLEGDSGLPVVVQDHDEDFQLLVEGLLESEKARRRLWEKFSRGNE